MLTNCGHPLISVVVPIYNEGCRLIPVIQTLQSIKLPIEIIAVNDGSTDLTSQYISKLRGIKVITHLKNLGKSAALKTGLKAAGGDIIAFIDSDLINFSPDSFLNLIHPITENDYDCSIGVLDLKITIPYKRDIDTLVSGQRVYKKQYLINNLQLFDDAPGFMVEANINRSYFNGHKIVKVFMQGVTHHNKFRKEGIKGIIKDFLFVFKLVNFFGSKEIIRQLKYCHNLKFS